MSRQLIEQVNRGTVLVASTSSAFVDVVGEMIADCGFTLAAPVESEAPWLSLTRTQPVLVICDCNGPTTSVKRLIAEVVARRLPLLMTAALDEDHAGATILPDRVAWLAFPIALEAFRAAIDALLVPARIFEETSAGTPVIDIRRIARKRPRDGGPTPPG